MASFDLPSEPLERALGCARRIASLAAAVLQNPDSFQDELRRLTRDLPLFSELAIAAFEANEGLKAEMRHALACLKDDSTDLAIWTIHTSNELHTSLRDVTRSGDVEAVSRWGGKNEKAYQECQQKQNIVQESANRAFMVANCARRVAETQAKELNKPQSRAAHSIDFRSVHWFGQSYSFTDKQSKVIELLWNAWENGTPDLGANTLISTAGIESARIQDVFKEKGIYHPAWNTMIVTGQGSKGSYRLQQPLGPAASAE